MFGRTRTASTAKRSTVKKTTPKSVVYGESKPVTTTASTSASASVTVTTRRTTKATTKKLSVEHLRYIRREAGAIQKQKIEELRERVDAALQVFDDHAVMQRFAEMLHGTAGKEILKQINLQLLDRLRSGRLSAAHNVVGLDLSKISAFNKLRDDFQKAREALNDAFDTGVEKIESEVTSAIGSAYLDSMPEDVAARLQALRDIKMPDLPLPAVI